MLLKLMHKDDLLLGAKPLVLLRFQLQERKDVNLLPGDLKIGLINLGDRIQFIYQSATITAANLFAFDYENRTRKEILLSSAHPFTAGVGIVLTSVVTAVLASVPAFLLGAAAFRLRIQTSNLLVVYLAMLPVMVGCAGLVLAGASGLLLAYHIMVDGRVDNQDSHPPGQRI